MVFCAGNKWGRTGSAWIFRVSDGENTELFILQYVLDDVVVVLIEDDVTYLLSNIRVEKFCPSMQRCC